MRNKIYALVAVVTLLFAAGRVFCEEPPEAETELKALVARTQIKLNAGQNTEADLKEDLKSLDALIAKHRNETNEAVPNSYLLKATLYIEVLHDFEHGLQALEQVQKDFPKSQYAELAAKNIPVVKKMAESKKIQDSLTLGAVFPDFDEKDTDGKPFSVAAHKGKVVLVDFWATWCPPCRGELPNVIRAYEKFHDQGFDIIGVTLDQDQEVLDKFLKQSKMTWSQHFEGTGWENRLTAKYGITSIPATFLIDAQGKIIAKNLRGSELEEAVSKALVKK